MFVTIKKWRRLDVLVIFPAFFKEINFAETDNNDNKLAAK